MALSGKQRVQQLFFNTAEQQFHSGRDLTVFNVIGRLTGVSSHGVAKAAAGWQALECCLAVLHGEGQKADKDLPGLCPLVMARMAIFKCFSAAIVRKLQMAGLAAHLCFWEKVPFLNSCWGCHWVCCVKGSARFTTDVPTAEEENGISVATSLPKILAAEASETVHVNIPVLAFQKNLRQSLRQFVTEGLLGMQRSNLPAVKTETTSFLWPADVPMSWITCPYRFPVSTCWTVVPQPCATPILSHPSITFSASPVFLRRWSLTNPFFVTFPILSKGLYCLLCCLPYIIVHAWNPAKAPVWSRWSRTELANGSY